ncbi:Gm47429 [Phodopus roborovskii]|uniref:Gm47429 protein n=1 Tax=Phodopus roborovskii TaxID=109678 RepID=A0AAU9ZMZ2_PHORO|nr:Gm47429 [Phodopus roborovskii]
MGGLMKKMNLKSGGDPFFLRKALMNNLGEEKRTKLHIQKLQKALNIRFREIEKEKTALKKFLVRLHKTTGYFPQRKFW